MRSNYMISTTQFKRHVFASTLDLLADWFHSGKWKHLPGMVPAIPIVLIYRRWFYVSRYWQWLTGPLQRVLTDNGQPAQLTEIQGDTVWNQCDTMWLAKLSCHCLFLQLLLFFFFRNQGNWHEWLGSLWGLSLLPPPIVILVQYLQRSIHFVYFLEVFWKHFRLPRILLGVIICSYSAVLGLCCSLSWT